MRRPTPTLIALLGVVGVLVAVLLALEEREPATTAGPAGPVGGLAGRRGVVSSGEATPPPVVSTGEAAVQPLLSEPGELPAERAAATASEDVDASAGLAGRVVDPDGRPLAGVTVTYMPAARDEGRWPGAGSGAVDRASLPTVTTGSDGRFALEVPWSGPPAGRAWNDAPDLLFDAPGFAARAVPCAGMSELGLELGDVLLESGAVLSGRVVDERLRPVPGVLVSVIARAPGPLHVDSHYYGSLGHFLEVVSDAAGRFTSRGLFPGRVGYEIIVPGYAPAREYGLQLESGQQLDVGDIALERGVELAGRVVDAAGVGVPGAQVLASDRDGRTAFVGFDPGDSLGWELEDAREGEDTARDTTDERGHFEVSGLRGGSFTVYVEAEGFEVGKATGLPAGERGVTVVLQPLARLVVEVVDAETGRALPAATLDAARVAFPGDQDLPVLSDGPGRFLVTGVGPVENRLEARAPGYGSATRYAPGVEPAATLELRFALTPAASVRGVVVDGAGEPLSGAVVGVRSEGGGPEPSPDVILLRTEEERAQGGSPQAVPVETLSDAAGAFRFEDLMAGAWRLRVEADGHAPYRVGRPPEDLLLQLAAGEQLDLGRLELVREARIVGRVVDRDAEPQAGVEVRLGPGVTEPVRTDAQGRFAFGQLLPGLHELRAERGALQSVEVRAGETVEVRLVLRTAPRLVGRVSAGGAPVEGARVFLREADDRPIWGAMIAERTAHTDARGEYALQLASVGAHELIVTTREGTAVTLDVTLDWDQEQRLDVPFGAGSLSGVVRDGEGEAVAGVRVSATRVGGEPVGASTRGSVRSGSDGRFTIGRLWPGEYALSARAAGYAPADSGPHALGPGATVEGLVVRLHAGARLFGTISSEDNQLVPDDMDVILVRAEDGERIARTGTLAGEYSFEGLPAGSAVLKIAEPGEGGDLGVEVFLHEETLLLVAGEGVRRDVVLPAR